MGRACPAGRAANQIAAATAITTTSSRLFNVRAISISLMNKAPVHHWVNRRQFGLRIAECGLRRRSALLLQHLIEHLDRLLHLFHRAERDARVRLFERREVARHEDVRSEEDTSEL